MLSPPDTLNTYCDRLEDPLLRPAEQLQVDRLQGPAPRGQLVSLSAESFRRKATPLPGQLHLVTHLKGVRSSLSVGTSARESRSLQRSPQAGGGSVTSNLHHSSTSSSAQCCFHPLLFTVLIPNKHLVPPTPSQRLLQENPTLRHLSTFHNLNVILLREGTLVQCVPKA